MVRVALSSAVSIVADLLIYSSGGIGDDGIGNEKAVGRLYDSYGGVWTEENANVVAIISERLDGARY